MKTLETKLFICTGVIQYEFNKVYITLFEVIFKTSKVRKYFTYISSSKNKVPFFSLYNLYSYKTAIKTFNKLIANLKYKQLNFKIYEKTKN